MSTPISMLRRDGSNNGVSNYPQMTDNSNMSDPKELMRQRITDTSNNMVPQQLTHDIPLANGNIMSGQQQLPINGINTSSSGIMRSESDLVEDILREMGESPGASSQSNISSSAFNYITDNAQIPPHKYSNPNTTQHLDMIDKNNNTASVSEGFNPSGLMNQISFSLSGSNIKQKITHNFKYPILVFIICLLLGLPEFNRFLFSFFPKLLLESGQVSILGVLLRALIGMIIFVIVGIFIL
jgi:hypothetical protein